MNTHQRRAPIIAAKIVIEPGAGEISQKAEDALLCADIVRIEINATEGTAAA